MSIDEALSECGVNLELKYLDKMKNKILMKAIFKIVSIILFFSAVFTFFVFFLFAIFMEYFENSIEIIEISNIGVFGWFTVFLLMIMLVTLCVFIVIGVILKSYIDYEEVEKEILNTIKNFLVENRNDLSDEKIGLFYYTEKYCLKNIENPEIKDFFKSLLKS